MRRVIAILALLLSSCAHTCDSAKFSPTAEAQKTDEAFYKTVLELQSEQDCRTSEENRQATVVQLGIMSADLIDIIQGLPPEAQKQIFELMHLRLRSMRPARTLTPQSDDEESRNDAPSKI